MMRHPSAPSPLLHPFSSLLLCSLLVATLVACGDKNASEKPNTSGDATSQAPPSAILLVTIDTLRPDALGWVAGQGQTPVLDGLSRASFRFPAAVSPTPLTLPAHVSLLTGLEPPRHGVRDNGQVLATSAPQTLAEALRARGFRTAAVVSGFPLKKMFGLDRGFDHYDDSFADTATTSERPAPATTAAALAWLTATSQPPSPRPLFLWVHYYDPHAPYEPPSLQPTDEPRQAYLKEVEAVDRALAELFAGFERATPGQQRLTVVTADHGESLGEHGEETHGFFIYDATTLVPALWHAPGLLPPGESSAPARLVDFAPTVLDLVGAKPFEMADGISLRPTLLGQSQKIPAAYLETLQPWLGYGWAPLRGLRAAEAKLIEAPTPELYQLAADPREEHNVFSADSPAARELALSLRERLALAKVASSAGAADAETIAALRSLGYTGNVTGSKAGQAWPTQGLADPKERLRQKVLLDLAEEAVRAGSLPEALATFDVVLAKEPDNRYALLRLGQNLVEMGDLQGALPPLERLLRLDPDQPEALFARADVLSRLGQTQQGIEAWQELLARQPRRAAAWSNLGALLVGQGKMASALDALERAHELEPNNAVFRRNLAASHLRLAAALANAGEEIRARQALSRALSLEASLSTVAKQQSKLASLLATAEQPPN